MDINSLIEKEYQWILSQSRKYCSNRMDAEDLAGDVVLRILSSKKSFDQEKPFRPWCCAIILNTYITMYNRRSLIQFTDEDDAVRCPSCHRASDHIIMHEYYNTIRCCRRKSCTIECVLLCAKGYSYDEISERLCVTEGTVKSRISYGRDMLRKAFEIQ